MLSGLPKVTQLAVSCRRLGRGLQSPSLVFFPTQYPASQETRAPEWMVWYMGRRGAVLGLEGSGARRQGQEAPAELWD